MKWFVLYVRSRAEKKVAIRLKGEGYAVFCPTYIEKRRWSDRIKKVEVPYFRSYVFVQCEESGIKKVLQTPGIVRRLFWLGKPAIISASEMKTVAAFFKDHKNNRIVQQTFTEGQNVYIEKGRLRNRKAVVIKNDRHKVMLSLPAMGCAFRVTLAKDHIGTSS